MPKRTVFQMLNDIKERIDNPQILQCAERFDAKTHGAKAGAKYIRLALAEVAKDAKVLRAEIQERKGDLQPSKKKGK